MREEEGEGKKAYLKQRRVAAVRKHLLRTTQPPDSPPSSSPSPNLTPSRVVPSGGSVGIFMLAFHAFQVQIAAAISG